MSRQTVEIITNLKESIRKLKNDFKRGIPPYQGFTLDISYGGNKEPDIRRVSVGSISHPEGDGKIFYDLVLNSLILSLEYWKGVAKREIEELYKSLEE